MHNIRLWRCDSVPPLLINDGTWMQKDACVTGTIAQEINMISSMDLSIYPNNRGYSDIVPYFSRVESKNIDGDIEFFGRILKSTPNLTESGEVYSTVVCEGYLGFLQDSSPDLQTYSGTVSKVIKNLFDMHYEQIGKDRFQLDSCEINDKVELAAEGETTYEFLINKIINTYDGEIVLTSIEGGDDDYYKTFHISIVTSQSKVISTQEIQIKDNLIAYSADEDVSELCTYVTPYGAKIYTDEDNLERIDITSVNYGKNYLSVENSPYGTIQRILIEQDIEDPKELLKAGQKYLDEHKHPIKSYNITAWDKHNADSSIPKIKLRGRYYVTAEFLGINHELLNVTKKTICIENPASDTFSVGNYFDTSSAMASGGVSASDLKVIYDRMNTTDTVNTYNLNAIKASIQDLDVENLKAVSAEISNLKTENADIKSLIFGTADGNHISVEFSDAVVSQVSDNTITNAMIKNLSADKISAGRISTNKVEIGSDDGSMVLKDETFQIADGKHIRVQIGKDANGDFNLILCDQDGKTLWSAKGITPDAIRDGLINDRMVADNANINASKIDMPSLIKEINNGKETIKASAIEYDENGQTLNISFNKIISQLMDDLGYNLYTCSKTMAEHWNYSGNIEWSTVDDFRVAKTSDYGYVDSMFSLTEGVVYTLSAYAKGNVFIYYPITLETDKEYQCGDFTRISYTFTYSSKKGKPVFSSSERFEIYKIKLEYGGALTDYCESAEEVNLQSTIEMSNVQVTNENVSFDLYKKDGLVTKTAGLRVDVDAIKGRVDEIGADYVTSSQLTQTANSINATVSSVSTAANNNATNIATLNAAVSKSNSTIVLKTDSNGNIVKVSLSSDADGGAVFKIGAKNISLSASDVLDILAGNTLNLTSKNIGINSDNFKVDKSGNVRMRGKMSAADGVCIQAGDTDDDLHVIYTKTWLDINKEYIEMVTRGILKLYAGDGIDFNGQVIQKIRRGSTKVSCKAGQVVSQEVGYGTDMDANSTIVIATPVTEYPDRVRVGVSNANQLNFTLEVYRTTDASTTINWIAIC